MKWHPINIRPDLHQQIKHGSGFFYVRDSKYPAQKFIVYCQDETEGHRWMYVSRDGYSLEIPFYFDEWLEIFTD